MSFSNYLEDYVLDLIFGNANYWQPWVSVGLSLSDPLDDGSGLQEPAAGEYERVLTDVVDWSYAYLGGVVNAYPLIFPAAESNWGLITHFALFDEDYYGVMLAHGEVSPSMNVEAGLAPSFDEGKLIVLID